MDIFDKAFNHVLILWSQYQAVMLYPHYLLHPFYLDQDSYNYHNKFLHIKNLGTYFFDFGAILPVMIIRSPNRSLRIVSENGNL